MFRPSKIQLNDANSQMKAIIVVALSNTRSSFTNYYL